MTTMHTIQVQLAIMLSDEAANALAKVLGPTLRQAAVPAGDADGGRAARLQPSQNAIFGGQKPPDDQGLLIDSRQAAKLLKVSARTLWKLHHDGEMPPAIRIGRAVRWSLDVLKKWIDEGCPPSRR
jgi:excisionase family DNA binding protein